MAWIHRSHPCSGDSEHFGNSFYNISRWLGQRQSKQSPRAADLGEAVQVSFPTCSPLTTTGIQSFNLPLHYLSHSPFQFNSYGNLKTSFAFSPSLFLIHSLSKFILVSPRFSPPGKFHCFLFGLLQDCERVPCPLHVSHFILQTAICYLLFATFAEQPQLSSGLW